MANFEIAKEDGDRRLRVLDYWTPAMAVVMKRERLIYLELNGAWGFRGDSIDFLGEIGLLEGLTVLTTRVKDDRIVERLHDLSDLHLVTGASHPLNFALLSNLRRLSLGQWKERFASLFESKSITKLSLMSFLTEH
ncbi:MAG: hypothetical protein ACR2HJ_10805 [Fimbriimonadales bacterium]